MPQIIIRNATMDDCPVIVDLIRELAIFEKLEHEAKADTATLQESLFGKNPKAYALLVEVGGSIPLSCEE